MDKDEELPEPIVSKMEKTTLNLPERLRLNDKALAGTNRSWYFGNKSLLAIKNSSNFKTAVFPKRMVAKSTKKRVVSKLNGGI